MLSADFRTRVPTFEIMTDPNDFYIDEFTALLIVDKLILSMEKRFSAYAREITRINNVCARVCIINKDVSTRLSRGIFSKLRFFFLSTNRSDGERNPYTDVL